jgi:hypothetical protein
MREVRVRRRLVGLRPDAGVMGEIFDVGQDARVQL